MKFLLSVLTLFSFAALAQDLGFVGVFPKTAAEFSAACERPAFKSDPIKRVASCMSFLSGVKRGYAAATQTTACKKEATELSPVEIWDLLLSQRGDATTPIAFHIATAVKVAAPSCR